MLVSGAVWDQCLGFGPIRVIMIKFQDCAQHGGGWQEVHGAARGSSTDQGGPRVLNFVLCCSRQLGVAVAEAGRRPMQAAGSSLGPLRGYVQCHRVRVGWLCEGPGLAVTPKLMEALATL